MSSDLLKWKSFVAVVQKIVDNIDNQNITLLEGYCTVNPVCSARVRHSVPSTVINVVIIGVVVIVVVAVVAELSFETFDVQSDF